MSLRIIKSKLTLKPGDMVTDYANVFLCLSVRDQADQKGLFLLLGFHDGTNHDDFGLSDELWFYARTDHSLIDVEQEEER
jgi:hypothetical protein